MIHSGRKAQTSAFFVFVIFILLLYVFVFVLLINYTDTSIMTGKAISTNQSSDFKILIGYYIVGLSILIILIITFIAFLIFIKRKKEEEPIIKGIIEREQYKEAPKELLSYVKKAIESGWDKQEIRKILKETGWPDELIELAFKNIKYATH